MSASRKDFEVIAQAIAPCYARAMVLEGTQGNRVAVSLAAELIANLCNGLAKTNPRFDAETFRRRVSELAYNLIATGDMLKAA